MKNPYAVALAARRMFTMTPEERQQVASLGGNARKATTAPAKRRAIAKAGGTARWAKARAKAKPKP